MWNISSPRLNEIELEILSFEELEGDRPDAEGTSLFKTRCLPELFARSVLDAAERVLQEHGEAGYREKWIEHPFPVAQLGELARLMERPKGG